jgi:hypothetical protein
VGWPYHESEEVAHGCKEESHQEGCKEGRQEGHQEEEVTSFFVG